MASSREELKNKIMRRVYVAHAVKWILRPQIFRMSILALSALALFTFVSITNVVANMPETFSEQLGFFVSAILNTEFAVQLTLFVAFIVAALFVRDVFRLSRLPHFNTF